MTDQPYTVSAVEAELHRRRRRRRPLTILLGLIGLGLVALLFLAAVAVVRLTSESTPYFDDPVEHFKYGSIGAEPASGLPYEVWMALPRLMPEAFEGRDDYSAFGFLYETVNGERRDLPIGISRRTWRGIDLVWFNCAVCHTGTYRTAEGAEPVIVPGMPSNNFDLYRFINFILGAAGDQRLSPEALMADIEENGGGLDLIDRQVWRFLVMPRLREELLIRRARLEELLEAQPDWGPGRVDTFNPYKVLQMGMDFLELDPDERIGAADFPSIFLQAPREGMKLHWDGNNPSLAERNLSAALGAGVTPETVDHMAIRRVADWLTDLEPPTSPLTADPAAVERGRAIYMEGCAACHGYLGAEGYVFEGAYLGEVVPIGGIGTDPARLNSYTPEFNRRQLDELFINTPHRFRHFRKTDGYANAPLDGLWLRGPFLHNGAVPTLEALLSHPDERPDAWLRESDVVDADAGGFLSPPCDPAAEQPGFCFDTSLAGNGRGGHLYGTELPAGAKADLLAYLKTF